MTFEDIIKSLNLDASLFQGGTLDVASPIDGKLFAKVKMDDTASVDRKIAAATEAFKAWKLVPAPRRGERRRPRCV